MEIQSNLLTAVQPQARKNTNAEAPSLEVSPAPAGDKFEATHGHSKHKTGKKHKPHTHTPAPAPAPKNDDTTASPVKPPHPHPAPTPPAPHADGPSGDVQFSYNPKDVTTMEPESMIVHGLKGGQNVETDRLKLSTTLLTSADGGYLFNSKGDPNFTAANSFSSVANAQTTLDQAFGKVPDSTGKTQLTINADRGVDFNAYFQPAEDSVNFFHDTDPKTGEVIKSGDAGDVVGHEYGHKDLNDRRPNYFNTWSADPGAFHESYGDVTAFLEATQNDSVIKKMVEQTGGDLSKTNIASESAAQLGKAINDYVGQNVTGGDFIRNANNSFKWADPSTLEDNPRDPNKLGSEVHNFSRLWTGAFYDVFKGLTAENIKAGQDPATAIKNASTEGLAMYGRLFGANGTAPEGDFTYKDMANAWIKGEKEQGGTHADLVRQVMTDRGILPASESLFDSEPVTLAPGVRNLAVQLGPDFGDLQGARVETKLSGAGEGIFQDDDSQMRLQAQIAKDVKDGNILVRKDANGNSIGGTPSVDELRKPQGGFYKGYLDIVDGQKTLVRNNIVD